jgi:hypothetical protein
MSAPWTSRETWLASMQSALASLVKTYQRLEREKVYRESGLDCTKKSSEQLTMYDLLGCSSKTPLQSALEAVTSSSQTLWREDIPGETDELPQLMLGRGIYERDGFVLLPTPRASMWKNKRWWKRKDPMGNLEELPAMDKKWEHLSGKFINPQWIEWMMLWPIGWTDPEQSETAKFRSRPRSRGKSLEDRK